MMQVVPKGFMRIRYFGFLANTHRKQQQQNDPPVARCPAARDHG
jgi:hypothetical protein